MFRIRCMAVVFFITGLSSYAQQKQLLVPVEFKMENGSTEESVVKVSSNGKVLYSIPGKSNFRLKLYFNKNYLISFSKQGFITKTIAIETHIPSERLEKQVHPYKIGVVLFKQYEGINIVVYNQPVAKIRFSSAIDEFDYDTDYTKSILSKMSETEQQLKQKAEEERLNARDGAANDLENAKNEKNYNTSSNSWFSGAASIKAPKPVSIQRNKIISEPVYKSKGNTLEEVSLADFKKDYTPANETVQNPILNGDNNMESATALNKENGADENNTITSSGDSADRKMRSHDQSMEGRTIPSFGSLDSDPGSQINNGVGTEIYMETTGLEKKITFYRKRWEEKGRTITIIKMIKGLTTSEYRKVNYAWGGLYYFKGQNFTISPAVYHWATGEY